MWIVGTQVFATLVLFLPFKNSKIAENYAKHNKNSLKSKQKVSDTLLQLFSPLSLDVAFKNYHQSRQALTENAKYTE